MHLYCSKTCKHPPIISLCEALIRDYYDPYIPADLLLYSILTELICVQVLVVEKVSEERRAELMRESDSSAADKEKYVCT